MALLGAGRGGLGALLCCRPGNGPLQPGTRQMVTGEKALRTHLPKPLAHEVLPAVLRGRLRDEQPVGPRGQGGHQGQVPGGAGKSPAGAGPSSPDPRPVSPGSHRVCPPCTRPERWTPTGAPTLGQAPWRRHARLLLPAAPASPSDQGSRLTRSAAPSPPARRSSGGCGQEQDRGVRVGPP